MGWLKRATAWIAKPPYDGVVWLAWLYVVAACLYTRGTGFNGNLVWFDDRVRMVQVLNWINGPSLLGHWYDRTIMRVNLPEGFHTIWSRLVDIPIAAVILGFQHFIGQRPAAMLASVLIPLVQVLLLFYAASSFARPMVGKGNAKLITLFVLFTSCLNAEYFTLAGFQVGAASHHSWYVIFTLVLFAAAGRLAIRPSPRDGLIAGGAIGALLAIGIEGLPLIAGLCFFMAAAGWWLNRPNFVLGRVFAAREFKTHNPAAARAALAARFSGIPLHFEPHLKFKRRVPLAVGLIRTCDTRPYANLILESA